MSETLFLQLCRFGDCVQSTVLIAAWRERHPNERIVVLTHPSFAPAFRGNPDIDELLLYEPPREASASPPSDTPANLEALGAWVEPLKRRGFRAVVNLTHDRFSCMLVVALGPELLRGLTLDAADKMFASDPWSLYLLSLLKYRDLNLLNLVDVYAHLSGGPATQGAPRFVVDGDCRAQASQWLRESRDDDCLIGFQPGASKVERRWPAESFIQLGRELAERHGARILVFGSKDEELLAQSIASSIPGAQSYAGRTTIPQLAALLERCKVLVTNDTGTMHMAAAVGVRIVAMFESSAYFRETGPYGSGHWIIQSRQVLDYGKRTEEELNLIRRIPIEHVSAAVSGLLAECAVAPVLAPPSEGAAHYRSLWSGNHIDFLPVGRVPLTSMDLCSRLQRPVWLALLDGGDPDSAQSARETMTLLSNAYTGVVGFDIEGTLQQFLGDVQKADQVLRKLRNLVDIISERLRKNPSYRVPDDQLRRLTNLEQAVLETGSSPAVKPFVAYFETALAMVAGTDTRQYLRSYRQPVIFLAKQLKAFESILKAASASFRSSSV